MIFTIAIPTYNNEGTIAQAIEKALAQSYQSEYEVLVVNNASTDGTPDEISKFKDPKIRIFTNSKTVDMYANHNICLKEAKGDYVLFCHSDDMLCEDALTILSEVIEKRHYPKRYIVWGHSMFRDYQIHLERCGQQLNNVISGMPALDCFSKGGVSPSGTCYSKESLMEIGGFPTLNSKVQLSDWYILIFCVFKYFEFEMIDRLLFIREYGSTAVNEMRWKDWKPNYVAVLNKLEETLNRSQLKTLVNYIMNDIRYLSWTKKHVGVKQIIKVVLKSMIRNPIRTVKCLI